MGRRKVLFVGVISLLAVLVLTVFKCQTKEVWTGEKHSLAIVAITTAPENLWDPETGIYVKGNHDNYLQEGKDWERLGEIKFYEADGRLGFEHKIGLRIHGNNMRSMPQKPFRIYIKDVENRDEALNYPLFGSKGNQWYSSFVLRVGDSQYTTLRDRLAHELVGENSSLDVQQGRPVVVYLNGEYWGLYYLQERFDETYFYEKYRINPKAVTVLEVPLGEDYANRGQAVAASKAEQGEAERYNRLLLEERRCRGCFGYELLNREAEADNLLDYLLFELFFANLDWPYNNTKVWRYQIEPLTGSALEQAGVADGRFRWLLFDLDVGFGSGAASKEEMAIEAAANHYDELIDDAFPFRNLFYEPEFQGRYLKRVKDLVKKGLTAERMLAVVDRLAEEIRPEMPKQIERWGSQLSDEGFHGVSSLEEWERRIELLKEFVQQRPEKFLEQTVELLGKRE